MKWMFVNAHPEAPRDNADRSIQFLFRVFASKGDQCLIAAAAHSRWPGVCRDHDLLYHPVTFKSAWTPSAMWNIHRLCRGYKPDIILTNAPRTARFLRLAWPSAAIGLITDDDDAFGGSCLDQWTLHACIDRVLVACPAGRPSLLSRPYLLPQKIVSLCDDGAPPPKGQSDTPPTAMTERVRNAMTDSWTGRQSQRANPVPLHTGWAWVRSSDATISPDAGTWDKCTGAEPIKSDKTIVHRVQNSDGIFYTKRFHSDRLYLRHLGLRRPAALQNFRIAFQARSRGVHVVPHIAAWWGPGATGREESLLITGTIPNAITANRWIDSCLLKPEERRQWIRSLAFWLAHLHSAGVACHDLKLSNILVHRPSAGPPVFTLLDLDNCRLRPCGVTGHDIQRNFHQLFRSSKHRSTPADVLRFLGMYRRERRLGRAPFRRLLAGATRRILRHGDGSDAPKTGTSAAG